MSDETTASELELLDLLTAPSGEPSATEDAAKAATAASKRKWRIYYSDAEMAKRFLKENSNLNFIDGVNASGKAISYWRIYDQESGLWTQGSDVAAAALIVPFLLKEYEEAEKSKSVVRHETAEVCLRVFTATRIVAWIKPLLRTSEKSFDTYKDLIPAANGVIDLRTATLLPHDPKYKFTRGIRYPYVPGAKSKRMEMALEVLPADALHQFQLLAGNALTGHQPQRSQISFFWANGENGKSTLIDLLHVTAGGFSKKPNKKVLLRGDDSNFHTIHFKGARQAIIEEIPDEKFLDGGAIRDLAGTTDMVGEHKGKDVEEFEMESTIFVSFNDLPQVVETARGVWRRLLLFRFPFTYVRTPAEIVSDAHRLQDPMMKDLWKKDEEAVVAFLAWRVEGARKWYAAGMVDADSSPTVEADTRWWRFRNDTLAHWWTENCVADPHYFVLADDALDSFNDWRNSPKTKWGRNSFIDKLVGHSLFKENSLEYRQTARHRGLTQSQYRRDNAPDWEQARVAKTQATYIYGFRFKGLLDDLETPEDASEAEELESQAVGSEEFEDLFEDPDSDGVLDDEVSF